MGGPLEPSGVIMSWVSARGWVFCGRQFHPVCSRKSTKVVVEGVILFDDDHNVLDGIVWLHAEASVESSLLFDESVRWGRQSLLKSERHNLHANRKDPVKDWAHEVYSNLPAAGPTPVACLVLGSIPISPTPPTPPRATVTTWPRAFNSACTS